MGSDRRQWSTAELLLTLELVGLAAFAFSRPVLDSFGRSPETFILRDASRSDIILFGLGVTLVPILVVAAGGALVRLLSGRHRHVAHTVLLALLSGVGAWRMGQDQTGWPGTAARLVLLGMVMAVLVGFGRWWSRSAEYVATFLRYASMAVLVFLVQFYAASPAGELVFGNGPVVNVEVAGAVAETLDDDPPPVLLVVFDALPTRSLLDGEGEIDGEVFPSFGALAEDATFYRNNTAVAGFTAMAVPAILTGRFPEPETARPEQDDESLFTLLAGNYDMHVQEQVTQLCPEDLCGSEESAGVGTLFGDAVDWWVGGFDDSEDRQFELSGLDDARFRDTEEWIDGLELGAGERSDLTVLHSVLPHTPWQFTDEGELYEMALDSSGYDTGTAFGTHWSDSGVAVAEQRHMLMAQAADRLLGDLLAKLDEAGAYDDTMVIVTADHGMSFGPSTAKRAIEDGNEPDIAWVPLLVKAPGQGEGEPRDDNVMTVDVVPTIADELGIDLPWDVDGIPVDRAADEPDRVKVYSPHQADGLQPEPGEEYIRLDWREHLDDVLDYRPATGSGPDGVWKLTDHGELFGRDVAGLEESSGEAREEEREVMAGEVVVDSSEDLGDTDVGEPLQLEVVAGTDLDEGQVAAFALNGTIAALGEVQPEERGPGRLVHGMLPPWLFEQGENELTAYLVDGEVGSEVLHPLAVTFD